MDLVEPAETRLVSAELSEQCLSAEVPAQEEEVESTFVFRTDTHGDADERPVPLGRVAVDEDGDLIVPRRKAKRGRETHVTVHLHHRRVTPLDLVGLQVWKGALLICDYLLMLREQHMVDSAAEGWAGGAILELGAGSGLPSILCSRHVGVPAVLTDYCPTVLDLAARNVQRNHIPSTSASILPQCLVRKLDWASPADVTAVQSLMTPQASMCPGELAEHPHDTVPTPKSPYAWCESDRAVLSQVDLLLAADVVYDDDLTEAFFSVLRALLDPETCPYNQSDDKGPAEAPAGGEGLRRRRCVVALEKRWNFSLEHMRVEAHGYATFRSKFREVGDAADAGDSSPPYNGGAGEAGSLWGRRIDVESVPQYAQDYERGSGDLELWEIFAASPS